VTEAGTTTGEDQRKWQVLDDYSVDKDMEPRLPLDDSVALAAFLAVDLVPEELDKTASRLWVVSTQSSSNTNPLHHQIVKGREIAVTEQEPSFDMET